LEHNTPQFSKILTHNTRFSVPWQELSQFSAKKYFSVAFWALFRYNKGAENAFRATRAEGFFIPIRPL
jgi:hypothetical protein